MSVNDNDKSKYLMISNKHNKIYNLFYFVSLSSNVSINKFPDGSWKNYFDLDEKLQKIEKDYLESIEKESTSKKDSVKKKEKLDKFTETYNSIINLNEKLNIEDYKRCFDSFKDWNNEYESKFNKISNKTNKVIEYLNLKERLEKENQSKIKIDNAKTDLKKAQGDFDTFISPYRTLYRKKSIPEQTKLIKQLFTDLIQRVDIEQKELIHNVIIYIKNCIWGNNNEKIIFTANNQKSLYEILNKKTNDNSEDDKDNVMVFNESIKPYESNTNNDYINTYKDFYDSKETNLDAIINIMETEKIKFERFLYKIENYVNKKTPLKNMIGKTPLGIMIESYPNIPNELKLYKEHPSVKFNIINACKQFYLRFNDQFYYEHGVTTYKNDTNDTNKCIIDIPINDTESVSFKVGEYVQKIFKPSGGKSKKKRKRRTSKKLKKTRKRKNR